MLHKISYGRLVYLIVTQVILVLPVWFGNYAKIVIASD
ncbi:putative membrane protein [Rickettsia amblyommatis str. Ac/Pa]|uniref:Putative membrane protein n=1 Tax=Rickettsia amblyommatis str. Ac/Pa TaxID=1359164 RepID=A0A0F3N434_RICAM|nr:putative membrane protein [Rickettsia amblyommatis str. Ac/Pa]